MVSSGDEGELDLSEVNPIILYQYEFIWPTSLINFVSILKPNGKSSSIFLDDFDRSLLSSSNEMHAVVLKDRMMRMRTTNLRHLWTQTPSISA